MHVSVARTRCIGSGQCALALPDVFDQDPADGRVVLLDPEPPGELRDAVEEAVDRCPVQAISTRPPDTTAPDAHRP
ncbi:ferredoxin [Streptomyces sp. WAC06614]|uniref:ferredoxin n=1 Tax=Streptomyces sp. WAC06614 TaxID=2487416 RepID=UPI000F7A653B|nr:ferredoxin [Streptomyces sp. WAC06614]RSS82228.1 ferredoxin [Streptomyces sp. WAC06614]